MASLRVFLFLASAALGFAQFDLVRVSSPDTQIEFRLYLTHQPDLNEPLRLSYEVSFHGKLLIDQSYLGLQIQDQPILAVNLGLMTSQTSSVDESYTIPVGKTKAIRNRYNSLTASYIQNGSLGRLLTMEVRVFDDGIAFRYVVPPSNPLLQIAIEDEVTEFQFAKDADAYPLILSNFQTSYEDEYTRMTLSGIHSDSLIALPFLVNQPGVGWAAVTEANIDNYAGMYLTHTSGRTMISTLAPHVGAPELAVLEPTPMHTPWRVVLIGSSPGRLIESNIVTSLNPPSAIADTSWIKPGKSVWNWWSGADVNTATVDYYIDFAADSKLDYMLIDEGWAQPGQNEAPANLTKVAPAVDMAEILRHAKSKGVGVWLWAHWTSLNEQMEEAFSLFEKWGVAGVLVDGMNRDDQWMVNFYGRIAKSAATHHLMIDFHGAYKPDGINRTYPNVLTRESVLGSKYLKWSGRATPAHDVMLAFTRMLAGPMDYAPGGFDNVTPAGFEPRDKRPMVMGTRAHQLALYVVFESPLTMVADAPEAYREQKDFELIRAVPTTWDETRVVNGTVGDFITLARRSGTDWYLGSITNWTAREVEVPLDFLGSGTYVAEIYADASDAGVNPKHSSVEEKRVTAATRLKVNLASGGGAAIRFHPAP